MKYKAVYKTPDGYSDMIMLSDGEYLTDLFFDKSKDASRSDGNYIIKDLPIFRDTCKYLDIYFSGEVPSFVPKYKVENLTPFREEVIKQMLTIPYGEVLTYGDISNAIAKKRNLKAMSSQAVGGAVGWNPICIIIPCHRVVGSGGNLTGYGGGVENKILLLEHEGNDMSKFFVPKN